MRRRFPVSFLITLAAAPVAAALRLWTLRAAVDSQGLPVMHPSVYALIAVAAAFLAFAAAAALLSQGRSGRYQVLQYDGTDWAVSLIAALLILAGGLLSFWEGLTAGPKASDGILVLLALVGGICLAVTAWSRKQGVPQPAAEVLPAVYLLVRLLLNFRRWSTDPIILDYGFLLFASIFLLLAVFRGAGFVFDQGKARRTLFCAMGAVFFCAAAVMDGLLTGKLSSALICAGGLLWQLPVLRLVQVPSAPDPRPEPAQKPAKKE